MAQQGHPMPGGPSRASSVANGPPSAGMGPSSGPQQAPPPSGGATSQQNLNQIVSDFATSKCVQLSILFGSFLAMISRVLLFLYSHSLSLSGKGDKVT
jgi:hypothetical protein